MKYNFIDLFSGAGGLSAGLIDAGFKCLLGVDHDAKALETFRHNHDGALALNIDLSSPSFVNEIKLAINNNKVDMIVGGPPCQGFSLTGTRNFFDKRNTLYLAMIEAVKEFMPKAFIVENVTGLGTLYGGQVKEEIIRQFEKIGYTVSAQVLTASDYGVPQIRRRIFFVGLKKEIGSFKFPNPTHDKESYITCLDALSDLPSRENEIGSDVDKYTSPPESDYQKRMRKSETILYNHVATKHSDKVVDVISLVPEGGNHKDLPEGIGEHRKFNEAWTRYHSLKPSRTIDTGHRNHFHYKYNRVPTIRENARLQSFSDSFVFFGSKTQQNRQVGNAVPPLLAKAVGIQIQSYLQAFDAERYKLNEDNREDNDIL